jgi:hypothetical protein
MVHGSERDVPSASTTVSVGVTVPSAGASQRTTPVRGSIVIPSGASSRVNV